MELGFIGLGKMGKNMVFRLLAKKHKVVVWNHSPEAIQEAVSKGGIASTGIPDLCKKIKTPRVVWIMIPQGQPVTLVIDELLSQLQKGDLLIDGGNSRFSDSTARYQMLKAKGISFMDIGTSGGLTAAKAGYCFMAGGDPEAYKRIEPALKDMAIDQGCLYCGPAGSGHYVKMVHNAIEYGMMQAIAEGFDLMKHGTYKGNLNMAKIAELWTHGSIVRGLLMELCASALKKDPGLARLKAYVDDSGEGRWSAIEAIDKAVPFTVNTYAVHARHASRQSDSYAMKLLAALRNEFGGHEVKRP